MFFGKKKTVIISHWNTLLEGLQASPKEFFAAVEDAIEARRVPDTRRSRIDWKESGILSAKREYLRVRRKEFAFDICGAPFGNGFFVSWWLGEIPSGIMGILLSIPVIEFLVERMFKPLTYYRVDTALTNEVNQ